MRKISELHPVKDTDLLMFNIGFRSENIYITLEKFINYNPEWTLTTYDISEMRNVIDQVYNQSNHDKFQEFIALSEYHVEDLHYKIKRLITLLSYHIAENINFIVDILQELKFFFNKLCTYCLKNIEVTRNNW